MATAPANFPTPVVNGEPVAPVLNTVPAQTRHVELTQQQAAINLLQQQVYHNTRFDTFLSWRSNICFCCSAKGKLLHTRVEIPKKFFPLPKPLPQAGEHLKYYARIEFPKSNSLNISSFFLQIDQQTIQIRQQQQEIEAQRHFGRL